MVEGKLIARFLKGVYAREFFVRLPPLPRANYQYLRE
jgi:hypothetical protein